MPHLGHSGPYQFSPPFYADDPCGVAGKVEEELGRIRDAIDHHPRSEPFELIPALVR